MMRLPSIQQISRDAVETLKRFPLVLLSALVGTIAALILVDYEGPAGPTVLFPILLASALGIPLLIGCALFSEKRNWTRLRAFGLQGAGILLLVLYGMTVPLTLTQQPVFHFFRFLMLGVALHFLVAVLPFAAKGEVNGFWQYNKSLFLRILIAALFTVVLYAGLSIALAALNHLFGLEIPGKRYAELWILLNGLFTTWFFLAAIPEELSRLETVTEYPKGLKIFAQYVLFPIVLVYVVILYAYLAKILIAWDWPKGWVSGLILGFSTAGILSFVLLHPLRERPENRWIKSASRWFVVVMIPLVAMLLLAVWRRVSEYGVTEGRYIAAAFGVWLGVMVLYFLLSKGKSIKAIPLSLGIFALLASAGPWGAFDVSERSQVGRLESLLTSGGILVDGKIRKAASPVPPPLSGEISSILNYLHDVHGYGAIEHWFSESLRSDTTETGSIYKQPSAVAGMMGAEYVTRWEGGGMGDFTFNADRSKPLYVGGYAHLLRSQFIVERKERKRPGEPIAYRTNAGLDTLTVCRIAEGKPTDSLQVSLRPLIDALVRHYGTTSVGEIPPERMVVESADQRMKVKLQIFRLQIQRRGESYVPLSYETDLLCSAAE